MGFISRTKITRYWPVKGQKHPIDRARWRQKSGAATELVSPHYTLPWGLEDSWEGFLRCRRWRWSQQCRSAVCFRPGNKPQSRV